MGHAAIAYAKGKKRTRVEQYATQIAQPRLLS